MSKAKINTVCGLVVIICWLTQSNMGSAATFNVGDGGGWTFNVAGWPNGKSFKAGDVLVFKYPAGVHTVVEVDKSGFDSCTPTGTTFRSGNDRITLKKGNNFFICGIDSHCSNFGMKISLNAA